MWIFDVLLIVFLVLKVAGLVDWSWWVILAPLYIAFSLGFMRGIINRSRKNNSDDLSA